MAPVGLEDKLIIKNVKFNKAVFCLAMSGST